MAASGSSSITSTGVSPAKGTSPKEQRNYLVHFTHPVEDKSNVVLGISMEFAHANKQKGAQLQTGPRLEKTIDALLSKGCEVTLLLGDGLQVHNLMAQGMTEEEALAEAKRLGDEFMADLKNQSSFKKVKKVIRWGQFLEQNADLYVEVRAHINNISAEGTREGNPFFVKMKQTAGKRKGISDLQASLELQREEYAGFIILERLGYQHFIYPRFSPAFEFLFLNVIKNMRLCNYELKTIVSASPVSASRGGLFASEFNGLRARLNEDDADISSNNGNGSAAEDSTPVKRQRRGDRSGDIQHHQHIAFQALEPQLAVLLTSGQVSQAAKELFKERVLRLFKEAELMPPSPIPQESFSPPNGDDFSEKVKREVEALPGLNNATRKKLLSTILENFRRSVKLNVYEHYIHYRLSQVGSRMFVAFPNPANEGRSFSPPEGPSMPILRKPHNSDRAPSPVDHRGRGLRARTPSPLFLGAGEGSKVDRGTSPDPSSPIPVPRPYRKSGPA